MNKNSEKGSSAGVGQSQKVVGIVDFDGLFNFSEYRFLILRIKRWNQMLSKNYPPTPTNNLLPTFYLIKKQTKTQNFSGSKNCTFSSS